jgi:hypothetical protein
MPAKKIRSAPAAALLSDTALVSALPFPAPVEPESDLASGLNRTLARRRDAAEAPAKASTLAKLTRAAKAGQPKPVRRKTTIGPRSGHK